MGGTMRIYMYMNIHMSIYIYMYVHLIRSFDPWLMSR